MAGDSAEVPGREEPLAVRLGARALVIVEDVVYAAAAVLLAIGAALALLLAGQSVLHVLRDQDETPLIELLNSLFLVFIFVELLYAVRITVSRRRVVAEPFLVVGILGAIKELLVLSVRAGTDYIDKGPEFARAIVEVGVLGALVLVLSAATLVLRRREREPVEEGGNGSGSVDTGDGQRPA